MKWSILILFVVALSGCQKNDSSSASSKSLFSTWTRSADNFTLDLTGGQLGVWLSYQFYTSSGEFCSCDLYAAGTEASGEYALANCGYIGGGSGDPGCSSSEGSGTYNLSNGNLRLCNVSMTCNDYR